MPVRGERHTRQSLWGYFLAALALVLWFPPALAATVVSGSINVDTLWRAQDGPFDLTGDVAVRNGATLTIEAGSRIYVRAGVNLVVERGALRVLGSAGNPVLITSVHDQGADTAAPGDWGQLKFLDGTNDSATLLQYVEIRYGRGLVMEAASPTLNNVTIASHAGPAIAMDLASSPRGLDNRAIANELNGVQVPAGRVSGDVVWGLVGIPFVVAQGLIEVGAPPVIADVTPAQIEQGSVVDAAIHGTRLSGAESVSLGGGLQAEILSGGNDTTLPVRITASANAPLGAVTLQAQVAAGTAQRDGAVTVISPLPPVIVTSIAPDFIRRGESKPFAVVGSALLGSAVTASNPGLAVINLQTTDVSAAFTLTASDTAALGAALLSFSNPGVAKGIASVQIQVQPPPPMIKIVPAILAIPPDNSPRQFRVGLTDADTVDHPFTLSIADSSVAAVSPTTFTLTAGQTDQSVTLRGLKLGQTTITVSAPGIAPLTTQVYVTPEFASINIAYARLVRVERAIAPTTPAPLQVTPLLSRTVAIGKGAYVSSVNPAALTQGSGPVDLVVSGAGLEGVTGIQIFPPDGVAVGDVTAASDGRSVHSLVTVAPGAAIGFRQVALQGPVAPYVGVRPDSDRLLITPPQPEVTSIDPLAATPGTKGLAFIIRGRNFQGTRAISFLPDAGITVGTPQVSSDGSVITTAIEIAQSAPFGTSAVMVTTPAGTSSPVASVANTFRVVGNVGAAVSPIVARDVRVLKASAAQLGTREIALQSRAVTVAAGSAATSISPAAGSIGQTIVLSVSGTGLSSVTAIEIFPADGLTVGTANASADGRTVTVSVTIAADALQSLRTVRVLAAGTSIPFSDPARSLFRVTVPQPRIDAIMPLYLEVGAPPVTLTLIGQNFQNAQRVALVPGDGITIGSQPQVNADGTQAAVTIAALAGSATGPRTVVLTTPAGETSTTATIANTLTLVTQLGASITPIQSRSVRVLRQVQPTQPATQDIGPVLSREVHARRAEGPPPPVSQEIGLTTRAVNAARGAVATDAQAPALVRGSSGVLTITGSGLAGLTVALQPADGVTFTGAVQVNADGKQASVPLAVSPTATAGPREVVLTAAGISILFNDPARGRIFVAAEAPVIQSITPIVARQGQVITLQIRGRGLTPAKAVTAVPADGIVFEPTADVDVTGTVLTLRASIAPGATLGARAIQVVTPGASSSSSPTAANTLTIFPPE